MTIRQTWAAAWVSVALGFVAAGCGSTADPGNTDTPPPQNPAAAQTPTTTAIFDGRWRGTTNVGNGVSFRVLSGLLTEFSIELDFGSGCVYRAKTPSTFDPVDAVFPIRTDGKVSFTFQDPALRTIVNVEFTSATTGRGTIDSTGVIGRIDCPGRTLTSGPTPAGSFTLTKQ